MGGIFENYGMTTKADKFEWLAAGSRDGGRVRVGDKFVQSAPALEILGIFVDEKASFLGHLGRREEKASKLFGMASSAYKLNSLSDQDKARIYIMTYFASLVWGIDAFPPTTNFVQALDAVALRPLRRLFHQEGLTRHDAWIRSHRHVRELRGRGVLKMPIFAWSDGLHRLRRFREARPGHPLEAVLCWRGAAFEALELPRRLGPARARPGGAPRQLHHELARLPPEGALLRRLNDAERFSVNL